MRRARGSSPPGIGDTEELGGVGRGSVVLEVDLPKGAAGQALHAFSRGPDGRGGGDVLAEKRIVGLEGGRVQAAEHERCVGLEYVFMDLDLVGDGDAEVGQEPPLGRSTGCSDEPCVDHVGGTRGTAAFCRNCSRWRMGVSPVICWT